MCEACGEASDPGRLLLCDDCDISYHTYCLDPPLHTVPKGAWKCKWWVHLSITQWSHPHLTSSHPSSAPLPLRSPPQSSSPPLPPPHPLSSLLTPPHYLHSLSLIPSRLLTPPSPPPPFLSLVVFLFVFFLSLPVVDPVLYCCGVLGVPPLPGVYGACSVAPPPRGCALIGRATTACVGLVTA